MNWKDKKNAHLVPGRAWDSTLSSSLPTPGYYPSVKTKGQKLREVKPLAQSHKADPWKGQDTRPGGQCPKSLSSCGPHPVPGASYGLQESLPGLPSGAVPNCAWGRASRRRTWQKCPSSKRIPYQAQLNAEYIFCSWQSPLLQVSLGHGAEVVELRGSLSQTLTSVESPRCAEVGTTHSREPVILN